MTETPAKITFIKIITKFFYKKIHIASDGI